MGRRQANAASSPSTIQIEVGYTATLAMTQGPLVLTNTAEPTKIVDYGGAGPNNMADVIISGNNASRVLQIDDGVTVTIDLLSIGDGSTISNGGGIYNAGTLYLNIDNISGNSGFVGGGIYNLGTATLRNALSAATPARLCGRRVQPGHHEPGRRPIQRQHRHRRKGRHGRRFG